MKSARTIVSLSVSGLARPRCCHKKNPPAARRRVAAAATPYFSRARAVFQRAAAGLKPACNRSSSRAVRPRIGIAGAIFFEKLADDPFQFGRDLRISLANRLGRLIQECVEDDRGCRTIKRPRPGHHFVQDHAERPQIAARIHRSRRAPVPATCRRPCPWPRPAQ